jgi:hypothetical protein
MTLAIGFWIVGLVLFAAGMVRWSEFKRDKWEPIALGAAAGGLLLAASGIAMVPS